MKALVICGFTFYREALCSLLCQIDEQPTITEAVSIAHGVECACVNHEPFDLVVVNFDCLREDFDGLAHLTQALPRVPVVAFGQFNEDTEIRQAIVNGVSGCISPSDGWKRVVEIIGRVLKGEIVAAKVNERPVATHQQVGSTQTEPASNTIEKIHLTPRQLDVLEQIRKGASNKEIARNLSVAEGTVKMHCVAIFRELGVTNRTQAAVVGDHMAATRVLSGISSAMGAY